MSAEDKCEDKEAKGKEEKGKNLVTSPVLSTTHSVDSNITELLLDPSQQRFPALSGEAYNSLPTYPLRPSYREYHFSLRPLSRPVVFDGCPDNPHRPASVPIYQTATFEQPSSGEFGAYDYTRSGNPTRTALEKQVAMLEFAHAAFAFGTGMSALNCVTRLVKPGDTFLLTSDIYGGMHRLVQKVTALYDVKVVFVETWDLKKLRNVFENSTNCRLLHMESPSNPLMRITDIKAVSELCREFGCLLSIDNTMMTPHLQQPLNHGADIVVHSMTKFFGGHSDTMGGVVAVANEELAKKIAFFQNAEGSGLSPFDSWLFLRGIKTLAIRVERAQENAMQIAAFLRRQSVVKEVFYAGLQPEEHVMKKSSQEYVDFKVHSGQSKGGGSVLSFVTGNVTLSKNLIDSLRLFKITVSFGSCNSLVEMPAYLSHASIPEEERTLPEDLIRLSVGIEDVNDLIDDLQRAISLVGSVKKRGMIGSEKKWLKTEALIDLNKRTKPELMTPVSFSNSFEVKKPKTRVKQSKESFHFELKKSHVKVLFSFLLGLFLNIVYTSLKQ